MQRAAWSHPGVRGKPGLRGEHRLWSLLLLPGSHGSTGSLLRGSGPSHCTIQPAVCHLKTPTSHELWQTHIPLGFKFPNNVLLHPGVYKSGLSQWMGWDTIPPLQVGSVPSAFIASSSADKYSQKCPHLLKTFPMEHVCLSITNELWPQPR